MSDLFAWVSGPYVKPRPPDYQDAYRAALEHQWATDLAIIATRGITPPWQLEPDTLQQDEARLLASCADNGGVKWADNNTDQCLTTTKGIGLNKIANAKDVITRCLRLGYISATFIVGEGTFILNALPLGMDMLEDYEDQKEAGII